MKSPRSSPPSLFRLERKPPRPRPAPAADLRYTFMVVPDGGKGRVFQLSVSLRAVRLALGGLASVLTVLVSLAAVQAATLRRVFAHDDLVSENLALKARLGQVDRELGELAGLIQRVRVYDEQLKTLATRGGLPGFGPIDADEAAARRAWLDGVVPDLPFDAGSAELDPSLRAADLEARVEALAEEMRGLEPGMGRLETGLADLQGIQGALPVVWPVEGTLTSPFGYRRSPFTRRWKFHSGIDVGAEHGSSIYATNDGLVTFAGWDSGHGLTVDVDHGSGVATRYCHASRLLVEAGELVTAGDVVALVGSTGQSTGPHLHFEIFFDGEKVDPLEWLP